MSETANQKPQESVSFSPGFSPVLSDLPFRNRFNGFLLADDEG
jgi:hypothetical protein